MSMNIHCGDQVHEGIVQSNRAYVHVHILVEKVLNAIESNDTTELRELIAHVKSEYPDEWQEMETQNTDGRNDNEHDMDS